MRFERSECVLQWFFQTKRVSCHFSTKRMRFMTNSISKRFETLFSKLAFRSVLKTKLIPKQWGQEKMLFVAFLATTAACRSIFGSSSSLQISLTNMQWVLSHIRWLKSCFLVELFDNTCNKFLNTSWMKLFLYFTFSDRLEIIRCARILLDDSFVV